MGGKKKNLLQWNTASMAIKETIALKSDLINQESNLEFNEHIMDHQKLHVSVTSDSWSSTYTREVLPIW